MRKYFGCHNHTMYSNIRLLDCINRPEDLIKKAFELGMCGIAITDHECLSAHVKARKMEEEIRKIDPSFKVALGNEIYLVDDTHLDKQKYYHFILIAKDAEGYEMLKELSSTAWYNSYSDRGIERVPTLKTFMREIVERNKGHLIATTACIGGELSNLILRYGNKELTARDFSGKMLQFLDYCVDLFGEDFYIECAPSSGQGSEQNFVNMRLKRIADVMGIKTVVGTDAHYLTAADRPVHKAYLNSKDGDREVDAFYEFTYLMDADEVSKLLCNSFDEEDVNEILDNTVEMYEKIQDFSLFHKQDIPRVEVKDYPKKKMPNLEQQDFPNLSRMFESDDVQNRYWVNECVNKLIELNKCDLIYISELEEEARVKSIISEKLETNMFRYPNTLQHYIDLIWDCGSMVGAGRGSSCAALNHYLMGITQLDPIEWDLPFFRYLNDERVELGDIDIDICPSKRPLILQKIREERAGMLDNVDGGLSWGKSNLGCTLVATFGTEGTKSAILTACRGYRSDEYKDGIDVDEAQYMSSLIPQERGFLWTIKDVVYGNPEKGRKPVADFIREVNKYPGLLDIIVAIEGLINHRGSHASGVILFDGNPFAHGAFMKTPKGEVTTQFDLHDAEYMGQ